MSAKPRPAAANSAKSRAKSAGNAARSAESGRQTDPEVVAYLAELEHPLKGELESLRGMILGVSPAICEGIKWNSPSFRTTEWFATVNVHGAGRPPRPKDPPSLRLILHTGAKPTAAAKTGLEIADPKGLLQWLGKDRAMVTIVGAADFQAKQKGLEAIFRDWIRQI